MNYDVSAVLVAHREGWMAYPSLTSLSLAKRHAEKNNISVEIIIILDRTDSITNEYIKANCPADARLEYIDEGDASASRNHGVSIAKGDFIAFLDGDDLWSENWLKEAYRMASKSERKAVYHPQINILFDQEDLLLFRRDCEDPEFKLDFLNHVSYWSSLSFAKKEIYQQFPYQNNNLKNGFGYEDWQWSCETINNGFLHKIVPCTTHYTRRKKINSLQTKMATSGCLMLPSKLFLHREMRS